MTNALILRYLNPKNYIRKSINFGLSLLSPVIRIWERRKIKEYGEMPLRYQPIFIIGAPRTGSTILYQTLTNKLDVLYIDNLTCKLHKNLFFGFWLSNKLFKQRAHNCFKSRFGDTHEYGLHAPSECGGFWYRWLPRDRHFIDYSDINDRMISEIRSEITSVINYFGKPLVFNNNNAGMRIRLLKQCFPDAKYIVANRDPLYVAQSLLKVRKSVKGSYEKWWSIMPKNYRELQKKDYLEQVVLQHYFINKQIFFDLKQLPLRNYSEVVYRNFSNNKNQVIDFLSEMIGYRIARSCYDDNDIVESKEQSFDDDTIGDLKKIAQGLDWNDYTS